MYSRAIFTPMLAMVEHDHSRKGCRVDFYDGTPGFPHRATVKPPLNLVNAGSSPLNQNKNIFLAGPVFRSYHYV